MLLNAVSKTFRIKLKNSAYFLVLMTGLESRLDSFARIRKIPLRESSEQIPYPLVSGYVSITGGKVDRMKYGSEKRPYGGSVQVKKQKIFLGTYENGFLYAAISVEGSPAEIAYGFNSKREVMLVSHDNGQFDIYEIDKRDLNEIAKLRKEFPGFLKGYKARPARLPMASGSLEPVFRLFEYLVRYKP